ncbi:MAG: hypothetical protein OES47_09930 [Acidobacteriota bacterium]|nr:hypothetical protein [Acidobacteriota bacterium]
MSIPDFLVCVECESPCYIFEWKEGVLTEAICEVCGNDDPDSFVTPDDYDALAGG